MELNIVNETTETAYLRFDSGSPVFSLVGTDPNSGTIDTTTSYTIEPKTTLSGFNIDTIAAGRLLFSLELDIARDDRSLGVAIRRLALAQPRRQRTIDAASASLIDGYHKFEAEAGLRWTDGDAAVPAELLFGIGGPCMLTLHLGAATQYIDDDRDLTSRIA